MGKTFREYFPSADAILAAPVFDVAGVMLELLTIRNAGDYIVAKDAVASWVGEYGHGVSRELTRALSEAWAWLVNNGLIAEELKQGVGHAGIFVTRSGRNIRSRADFIAYAKATLLPNEILRGDLSAVVLPLFLGGHFDSAVAAAFTQVEVFVRDVCGYPNDLVGTKLMRAAFDPKNGPLTDQAVVESEREAAAHLFAGAMGYYKNPFSHRRVGISHAAAAASMILFANELLAQADGHARAIKIASPDA